jgi:hypothetical protein
MILKEEAYHRNACWGFCKKCGLVVCSGHGRRNENPWEYQCLYCTGDTVQHWRPYRDPDPHSPTSPPGTMEEFLQVFSDLTVKIQDEMKTAIIRYFKENGRPEDSPLDDDALSRAAEAYRRSVGIPQKRQQRVGQLV